jgi:Carboxypeptidase regulatory-like domain/Lamin Tail Domain
MIGNRLLYRMPLALFLWATLMACSGANVFAQYQIGQSVLPGGGGASTNPSPDFRVEGTIGQGIVGAASGGGFSVAGGFVPGLFPPGTLGAITGQVTSASNGQPLSSITISLSGPINSTVSTDASGNYAFSNLPPGNYIITPSNVAFTFSPSSSSQSVSGNSTAVANFVATSVDGNPQPSDLIISEFRLRGPGGDNDEFVELYNTTNSPLTINASDGSAGFSLVASDGTVRFTIPNGTVIPAHGHYLGVNSVGYSLASYPAGNSATATGDITYTVDIPDNAGIALFKSSNPANFTMANRLDAVGSTDEAKTLYKEGTGYAALVPTLANYSFYRDQTSGVPRDTNDNAADLLYIDANGSSTAAGQRLGTPGPENLTSPVQRNGALTPGLIEPGIAASAAPNRVRVQTPITNGTFGTIEVRRRYTNNTGAPVTRLRFRIVSMTTFPSLSGTVADIRALSSPTITVSGITSPATCTPAAAPCSITVQGTTLEQPPAQSIGGGYNSTLSADTVTLATPLANGKSINVRWLLGVEQKGDFSFYVNIEMLP